MWIYLEACQFAVVEQVDQEVQQKLEIGSIVQVLNIVKVRRLPDRCASVRVTAL